MTARKKPRHLSEGPSPWRCQHSAFTRDVLTPPGAPPVARHRARPILTPLEMRLAILEDAAGKPEAVRIRSLRRRLTVLDRALSDREAEALERLSSCIAALSNAGAIDYLRSEVRSPPSGGRVPFGERQRREIAGVSYVLKGLGAEDRATVLRLVALLDPGYSGVYKPDETFIAGVTKAAVAAVSLYDAFAAARRKRGDPVERKPA
ncbi:hypothetical protein KKP04_07785 [Rhodomicrobium sp. Az07]|uniref:hypothetical protein n=1 Tax=Rhodomicrobium sp. Az07 TaxID=2839034 RepID=UPI001BE63D68|nr:hypothetical protein [Rhodomicrobium sp. Az07]MBT3070764.1 hypothetical protein [Rhodomicrobium sp. Az07]